MKNQLSKQFVPILGVVGFAFAGLSAHAQTAINYNDGDLILAFSQAAANDDVEVDIGNLSNLQSLSGGSTYNLGNFSADLTAAGASINNLSFSVIGQLFGQSTYLSQKQSGANPNTPPANLSALNYSTANGKVLAIEGLDGTSATSQTTTGLLPWSQANGNSTTTALIPNANHSSYSFITKSGFTGAPPNVKNTTPASFTGSLVSDLFTYDQAAAGTGNPSVYDGYFTLQSSGELDFTSATVTAVPEPATYGLLAGAGLLLVSFRKQVNRKQA